MIPRPILPSPESSLAHARAQAEGATFESLLEWTNKTYLQAGRAAIYRNGIAARHIRTQAGDQMIAEEKSRPDFSGTMAGGISVHFDAKTMHDAKGWRLPKESDHQYRMLLDQARMGAIAFFIISDRAAGAVYLLRVHPEIPLDATGRPGLRFEDVPIADYRLKDRFDPRFAHVPDRIPALCVDRSNGGTYDWLTAVEVFWTCRSTLPPRPPGRPTSEIIAQRNEKIRKMSATMSAIRIAGLLGMNYQTVKSVISKMRKLKGKQS